MVGRNDTEFIVNQMEKNLKEIEDLIYNLEDHYLEETLNAGNVIRGWESSKMISVNKGIPQNPKKVKIQERERMFSLGSCTSQVNQNLKRESENSESKSVLSPGQVNNFIKSRRKARNNTFIRASRAYKLKNHRNGNDSGEEDSIEANDNDRSNKKNTKHIKYQKGFESQSTMHLNKTTNPIIKKKNKKKK